MDEKYLTIKIVVSDLGGNRYRSRIEQSPLGASSGSGWDFELTESDRNDIDSFTRKMPTTDLSDTEVRTFGQKLFTLLLDGKQVGQKYSDCRALTKAKGQPKVRLRLAIAVVAKDLWKIPWEYLHDGDGFLVKRNHTIIRVIDELAEQKAPYVPIKKLLVAIANPSETEAYKPFDANAHVEQLKARLDSFKGVTYEIFMPATKTNLEKAIRDGNFDAIYFLGHGAFSGDSEGHLILENDKQGIDPLSAYELSQFLTNTTGGQNVRFVYLNSCATSKTDAANVFAGVAQRLMLDGAVDSAVAMQTNVQQTSALDMALGFFDELLRGSTVEQAVSLARIKAKDAQSFGIPVIFSALAGPEELERNRIAHLLSADIGQSSYGFILPNFRIGVPLDIAPSRKFIPHPQPKYFYPGETLALRDTESAWDVLRLVSQIALPDQIQLMTASNHQDAKCSHWFLFGSKSNSIVANVLKNYSPRFQFDYKPKDHPGCWALRDLQNNMTHTIKDPHKRKRGAYENSEDIGVIEKVVKGKKTFFLFSGLGDRATRGCGWYFYDNWKDLLQEFGNGTFGIILRFPPGLDFSDAERLSRKTGQPFK